MPMSWVSAPPTRRANPGAVPSAVRKRRAATTAVQTACWQRAQTFAADEILERWSVERLEHRFRAGGLEQRPLWDLARSLCRNVLESAQIHDFAAGGDAPTIRREQIPGQDRSRQGEFHDALEGPGEGAGPAPGKRNLQARVRDKEPGWTALLRFRRLHGPARVLGRSSLRFHAVRLGDRGHGGALCPALADLLAQVVGLDELVAVQDPDEHGQEPQGADAVAGVDADRRQGA